MKVCITVLSIVAAIAVTAFGWIMPAGGNIVGKNDSEKLSALPVLKGGRLMPLSSAAADILRFIDGKMSFKINGEKATASEWLLYINAFPLEAAKLPFFKTDNRELQNLLGTDGRHYSYDMLEEKFDEVAKASASDTLDSYTAASREALLKMEVYEIAGNSFAFYFGDSSPKDTFEQWKKLLLDAKQEMEDAKNQNREANQEIFAQAYSHLKFFRDSLAREQAHKDSNIHAIYDGKNWLTPLEVLLEPRAEGAKLEMFSHYGNMISALKRGDKSVFSAELEQISKIGPQSLRLKFENAVNRVDIFYKGAIFYLISFILFLFAALFKGRAQNFSYAASLFLAFGLSAHVFGVCARMFIQMRPPVTNLYSSVIFAGAAAVAIGIFLLLKKKNSFYGLASAPVGFLSLLLALNLPYSGDTMGMMRAVLNSNFWLTVHIVPIMLGYCGVFLAGFAASFKLISNALYRGRYTRKSVKESTSSVYGILCFALFFSFAGTMLGGLWADMSWGRFWGWDPKENGALMVVLWCAFAVHCKAMNICSDRTVLALACLGNVVAAWAWFGVNMMGVGLHSYGFMDSGKIYLMAFAIIQAFVALLAFVPQSKAAAELESIDAECIVKDQTLIEEKTHKKAKPMEL